jgi:hypothetical protein
MIITGKISFGQVSNSEMDTIYFQLSMPMMQKRYTITQKHG